MKFSKAQERRFGTSEGAYSIVTDREYFDSQITLTDFEADLVVSHFRTENIHTGRVGTNPELASKPIRRYPDGERIYLNIVYPKPHKTELRLYISSRAGFKPDAGDVWFLYKKEGQLWIGAMSEIDWRGESATLKEDETDFLYQEALAETDSIRIAKLKERDIYIRDRNIALRRMELAGYKCEYNPDHGLFISRFTKKPYLEAHHIIPISLQQEFGNPLDTTRNIVCLCPHCHRAVHHAEESHARKILSTLTSNRDVLQDFEIELDDLYSLYAIEEILKE